MRLHREIDGILQIDNAKTLEQLMEESSVPNAHAYSIYRSCCRFPDLGLTEREKVGFGQVSGSQRARDFPRLSHQLRSRNSTKVGGVPTHFQAKAWPNQSVQSEGSQKLKVLAARSSGGGKRGNEILITRRSVITE